MDITDIQFPDGSFDVIICCHVLEHILDDQRAMVEICRILEPSNGWAILQVPVQSGLEKSIEDPSVTDPSERERIFGQSDHVRIYSESDYVSRLESAGFNVRIDTCCQELGEKLIEKYRLNPDEHIYYV